MWRLCEGSPLALTLFINYHADNFYFTTQPCISIGVSNNFKVITPRFCIIVKSNSTIVIRILFNGLHYSTGCKCKIRINTPHILTIRGAAYHILNDIHNHDFLFLQREHEKQEANKPPKSKTLMNAWQEKTN